MPLAIVSVAYGPGMAWIKVPPEHHPIFLDALPKDRRVETMKMFGGIAAKVNGHIFAGLFGRSAMVSLSDADRTEALALEGASMFDPMGDGRARSDKVMLPESVMADEDELRGWLARAFEAIAKLPPKAPKTKRGGTAPKTTARAPAATKREPTKR